MIRVSSLLLGLAQGDAPRDFRLELAGYSRYDHRQGAVSGDTSHEARLSKKRARPKPRPKPVSDDIRIER